MNIIPDAHTHLDFVSQGVPAVVNSVSVDDWQQVAQLCQGHPILLPAFGIHPWSVTAQLCADKSWADRLDSLLSSVPNASVGEVGLDRSTSISLDMQTRILERQLDIALQHNCAVSIHCFKAFDILIPIIRRYHLTYIMHGYSGSAQITKQLLETDCYFSFGMIRHNRLDKLRTIVPPIPKERLLVESDGKVEADLEQTADTLAQLCGITPEQLCDNFDAAF
ncbi:MAG: TatD family hydrolase [Spirochaetales bacterium]|nr:TatD family hydrolase [Spirochaetales bacterium]